MLILESEAPNCSCLDAHLSPSPLPFKKEVTCNPLLQPLPHLFVSLGCRSLELQQLGIHTVGSQLLGTRTLQLQVSPDVIRICVAKCTSVCRAQVFNQLLAFEEMEQRLLLGSIMLFNQGDQLQLSPHSFPSPPQFECFIQKIAISLTILRIIFTVFLINQSYIKP